MISAPSSRDEEDEDERLIWGLWWDSGELVLCALRVRVSFPYQQTPSRSHDENAYFELFILVALFGLASAACWSSVVMMGFRSPPFRLFLFPLPFAALFAAEATCLALLMAAFLMSLPFIILRKCVVQVA